MAKPKAITRLSETPTKGNRNWLIYAPSGVGKTVLAGTAPNALFLTVEAAGTESAKARGSEADEWVMESWSELLEAYEWLKAEGHKDYDWVILDSLTEMEEMAWNDQLESINKPFEARIQDYGIVDRKVKKLVDRFNRLPINVIYTAQQASFEYEDEDGDDVFKVLPAVGRAKGGWPLSNLICGKATLIGLLIVAEDEDEDGEDIEVRRLFVQGGPKWTAKDRHDTFDRYINDPDIAEMSKAVDARQQEIDKDRAPAADQTETKKKKKKEKG